MFALWVTVAVVAWLVVSVVVAIAVGRAVRLRDLADDSSGRTGDGDSQPWAS
ncbi:hypothetical protein [Williamsia sp.]|uniref:hypothetical protein n=1 Tax=Williamsia sp. TaxID=1872085 RepID=UPI002F942498